MAHIVPTITAENTHVYREQIERIEPFARHIHIDLMDGIFTPNTSIQPERIWWPEGMAADIHLMFQSPTPFVSALLQLQPRLIIIPAESDFNFGHIPSFNTKTKFGIAVLPHTEISDVRSKLQYVDHLLVFSGNLGYQGGSVANLKLLKKVSEAQTECETLEIGWDGGVSVDNVKQLAENGVDVINSGGFIHSALNPGLAYQQLSALLP